MSDAAGSALRRERLGSIRILAAPDSLKGVLRAPEAAAALARGARHVPGTEAVELPLADGGEGTCDVLFRALGGEWGSARVRDPLGRPVHATFLLLPDGTAVVEAASAIGLELLGRHERDPLRASSAGLGDLLLAALDGRPRSLVVALGGTATVDGGTGLAEVVGDRLAGVEVTVACDVRNPLLGERGAARVFAPQKGASPREVEELERRLAAMEELRAFALLPGAGAAGGLGARLAALGGRLFSGAQLVLDRVGFRERAVAVDLVVTGEGRIDRTSVEGKLVGEVAGACHALEIRCAAFGGVVVEPVLGAENYELSGSRRRVEADLEELGERLAGAQ